ncbi:MAG: DNA internalization-related competence protein ComEC/Rec2 [Bacillota bacterium]
MISRPLLYVTIAFILGIALNALIKVPWWVSLPASLALVGLAAAFLFLKKRNIFPLLAVLFFMLGMLVSAPDLRNAGTMEKYLQKVVSVEGYICRDPDLKGSGTVYTLGISKVYEDSEPLEGKGRVLLYVQSGGPKLEYGDIVRVRGKPYMPEAPGNPGQFDYGVYLHDRGIWGIISVKDFANIERTGKGGGNPVAAAALSVKQRLIEINRATLAPDQASLVNGMIFGTRGGIDRETEDIFNESGVVHILSVSGLHVGLVVAVVIGILKIMGLQRLVFPVLSVVLIIYSFITGMGPAVVRASLMAWIQFLGHRLGREGDWPTTLAASALVILAVAPNSLFEPGFQLSFAATWGILHIGPIIDSWLNRAGIKRPWARGTLAVSVGAIAGTMPLVTFYYNIISLISIPANILAVPIVGLILPSGLLAGMAGLLFIEAATFINYITSALVELMMLLVNLVHSFPGGVFYVATPPVAMIMAWYSSMFMLPYLREGLFKKTVIRVFFLLLLALFPIVSLMPAGVFDRGLLQVHVIDVGQGDSILVRLTNGHCMLVDAGGWKDEFNKGGGAGEVVVKYLRRLGIKRIDALVLTHSHEDHAGGAAFLLNKIEIGTVLVPPVNSGENPAECPDPAYYKMLSLAVQRGIPVQEVVSGDSIALDPRVSVEVLGPGPGLLTGTRSDLNNNSVVLSLRYLARSFLFTGDIEEEGQVQLLESGFNLKHDFLKAPHHGSRYTNPDFIERVNPGLTVISVGKNSFGQPHPDAIALFEKGERPVYRTDRDGLVTVICDGENIKVIATGK